MKAAVLLLAALLLASCKSLPDKPVEQAMYDFGPAPVAEGSAPANRLPLVLPDVQAEGMVETPALLYRLAYDDPHQLRPYAFARWTTEPGVLLRQRLQEVLGRERVVLDTGASATLTRRGGPPPPMLRVDLEEFSHVFDSPRESRGVLRVRATLLQREDGNTRVVAQRRFEVQRPAPAPDAAGGVRALTAAADALAQELAAWLRQP